MSDLRKVLENEFKDADYRYAYAESSLNTRIASQIKVLREQRALTQTQLAELCGTKQAGLSRLEDVNHSVWKTDTLWKIARALDVRLHVSFETFDSLIEEKEKFSRKHLQRPTFEESSSGEQKDPEQKDLSSESNSQVIDIGAFKEAHKHTTLSMPRPISQNIDSQDLTRASLPQEVAPSTPMRLENVG